MRSNLLSSSAAMLVALFALPVQAQNVEIIDQRLDADRHGYSVIRVWGSHYEMGYGMGHALAGDIVQIWDEMMDEYAQYYAQGRALTEMTRWIPEGIEDELEGLVDGVRAVVPEADFDATDLKMANIVASDLAYYNGCRSHSCWGQFVAAPVKTLSTRRLDFGTPFPMALHHVMCAWDPDDGVRWVNMSWPGMVTVVSAVNAHGTQVSTHDYGMASIFQDAVPRVVATRHVLSAVGDRPVDEHLNWAQQELDGMDVATSSFLNYFVPEGLGGVFTCARGGSCGALRTPQTDYFGGDVLMTTNSQTDGHSTPSGGSFMADYYEAGGIKDLQGHFDLMGTGGLHLLSVEYRGVEDMTLLAHGRGRSDFIRIDWDELFTPDVGPDGGQTDAGQDDAGQDDAGQTDAGQDAGIGPADSDEPGNGGCGCAQGQAPPAAALILIAMLAFALRRRSQVRNHDKRREP
ncbi:MAG: hypothetical protein JXR96_08860 [Deltaproteobacteria bacterium]|nr:hypothetical protein [Deltaproteobacteria bacterium]